MLHQGEVQLIFRTVNFNHCTKSIVNKVSIIVIVSSFFDLLGLEILAFPCNQFGAQEPGMKLHEIFKFNKYSLFKEQMKTSKNLFQNIM